MNKKLTDTFTDEIKITRLQDKIDKLIKKGYEISFQYYFSKKGGIQIMLSASKNDVITRKKVLFLPFNDFEFGSMHYKIYVLEKYYFGKMNLLKKEENTSISEIELTQAEFDNILLNIYLKNKFEISKSNLDEFSQRVKKDIYDNRNYIKLKYEPNRDDLK